LSAELTKTHSFRLFFLYNKQRRVVEPCQPRNSVTGSPEEKVVGLNQSSEIALEC